MCTTSILDQPSKWEDYFIQEGMLFKVIQFCIPRSSMRLNLIMEKHSGGLATHFGIDKRLKFVEREVLLATNV